LFLTPLLIADFDHAAAAAYGIVRAALERQGTPIGSLDILIATHALSLAVTLVTNNEREFARVAGLKLANWAWD
jgi:tRNA(fMet)-specific endonuclease VapC